VLTLGGGAPEFVSSHVGVDKNAERLGSLEIEHQFVLGQTPPLRV
jgi:hypothetical protein